MRQFGTLNDLGMHDKGCEINSEKFKNTLKHKFQIFLYE